MGGVTRDRVEGEAILLAMDCGELDSLCGEVICGRKDEMGRWSEDGLGK